MPFDIVGDTGKLCRVCMTAKEGHRTDLYDASSFVSGQPSLHGMLKAVCASVFDKPRSAGMPTKVCAICRNATLAAYKLHQMCIETDRRLGELLALKRELQEGLQGADDGDPLGSRRVEVRQERKANVEQLKTVEMEPSSSEGTRSSATEPEQSHKKKIEDSISTGKTEDMIKVEELDLMDESENDGSECGPDEKEEEESVDKKVKRVCKICSEVFYKVTMLRNHMTEKHQLYMCEICHETFEALPKFVRHKFMKHRKRPSCGNCGQKFESKLDLMNHKKKNSCDKSRKCCNEIFPTKEALTKHRLTHSFKCTLCDKVTNSKSVLAIHMRRHSGNKPFACSTCPMRFVTKAEVVSHNLTHTKTKNAVCDICGSKFTKKGSLKIHVRNVHEGCIHFPTTPLINANQFPINFPGYRPLQCSQCDLRFALPCQLRRHMYTHTGEKPYKCELCPQAYAQTGDLIKHVARVHGDGNPYGCDRCDESFAKVTDLRQHYRVHMAENAGGDGAGTGGSTEPMKDMRFTCVEIFKRTFGKGKPEDGGSSK